MPKQSSPPAPGARRWPIRGRLAAIALLATVAFAFTASVPGAHEVAARIGHVSPLWLALAVALEVASKSSYVAVYRLFFDRLPAHLARPLAWTGLASGALLPGGAAGGLAIGGWLTRLTGAPTRWIVRRSGGLFCLTAAVNTAALVTSGLVLLADGPGPHRFASVAVPTLLVLALAAALASVPMTVRSRSNAPRLLRLVSAGIGEAGRATLTRRPSWRLAGAVGYVGFDVAVLWVALSALGPPPSVPALILAYSLGHLAKMLPIPGGIGALDAGLTGALVLYGVAPAHAAAAVVVYHAIALWVPTLGGLVAYMRLRPRLRGQTDGARAGAAYSTP